MGHSMGSGGTWYLGAKYSKYWRAIAPMSGPFVDQANYRWANLKSIPILMSEGTLATPSLDGSRVMRDRMFKQDFTSNTMKLKPTTSAWSRWCCRTSSTSSIATGRSKLNRFACSRPRITGSATLQCHRF
ncbi:MAG: hypothetical protein JO323_10540 [Acidobacteriia bacterium]|nr:hypothetical protein [Terriglobia bacterium]